MTMTQTSFWKGSSYPELASDTLRIYSMRFCPYAQRTRLVLDHLKIPYQVVNIHLKSKPEWFLSRNPNGLVPTLEFGEKIIYESAVCDEYLDDVYGGNKLIPADPYKRARMRMLMDDFNKVSERFYAIFFYKDDEQINKGLEELKKNLKLFEDAISCEYFGGDEPLMVDFHFWPFLERLPMLEKFLGAEVLRIKNFPKLTNYLKVMYELPL